jgi:hypothetical protein
MISIAKEERCGASFPRRVISTDRREFAADSLQVLR